MKTLLILVLTLPTKVNPLATGVVELLDPLEFEPGVGVDSLWHLLLHPSPFTKFPSSHCSSLSTLPFPQIAGPL